MSIPKKDKLYRNTMLLAGGALFLWWLYHRKLALSADGAEAPPLQMYDPNELGYAGNPGANLPATNGSINVNATINTPNVLGYIPLFGFVGMAQGTMFQ